MYQNGAKTIGDFLSADISFMIKTDFSNNNKSSFKGYAQCSAIVLSVLSYTKYLKCNIKR